MVDSRFKTLVVEDSLVQAQYMQSVLDEFGFDVTHVETLSTALESLSTEKWDLILLDLTLPDSEGIQTIDLVLESKTEAAIVVLTAIDLSGEIGANSSRKGVQDFLLKKDVKDISKLYHVLHHAVERKRFVTKIEKLNKQLDQKNKDLEAFMNAATHDLKAPLRSVFALCDWIKEDHTESMNSEITEQLDKIQNKSLHMTNLIDSLLNYASVGNEKTPWTTVDLNEAVEEVKDDLIADIKEKKADIIVDGKLPMCFSKQVFIKQLLQNLISNAIKYSRTDTKPIVEISCQSYQMESIHLITIKDNGLGIDAKYLNRIFEPFTRLHSASEVEGSGVGLATVKRIVDLHEGEVFVKSTPGQGSSFAISLPIKRNEQDQSSNSTKIFTKIF